MEDVTVTGIVLSAMPYRENDRLIQLFSVELGKVTAILKGVASSKAKMKFAGQVFCFGKFDLTASKGFYVVKGVDLVDSFFDLTQDYDIYKLSQSMLEVCSHILKPSIIAEKIFITLIKSLQNIVYNKIDAHIAVLKFFLSTLEDIGYGLNFETCDNCSMAFVGDIKFDENSGTFRCVDCSGGVKVSRGDFMTLKLISSTEISRLHTLKLRKELVSSCFKLVVEDLQLRLNCKLKSLDLTE